MGKEKTIDHLKFFYKNVQKADLKSLKPIKSHLWPNKDWQMRLKIVVSGKVNITICTQLLRSKIA